MLLVRLTLFEPPMKRLTSPQRKQFSEIKPLFCANVIPAAHDSAEHAMAWDHVLNSSEACGQLSNACH